MRVRRSVLFAILVSGVVLASCAESTPVEVSAGVEPPVEETSGEGVFSADPDEQMAAFVELLDGLDLELIEATVVGMHSKRAFFEFPEDDVEEIQAQRVVVEEHFTSLGFTVIDRNCQDEVFDDIWDVRLERADGVVLSATWGRGIPQEARITLPYDQAGRPHTRAYFGEFDVVVSNGVEVTPTSGEPGPEECDE